MIDVTRPNPPSLKANESCEAAASVRRARRSAQEESVFEDLSCAMVAILICFDVEYFPLMACEKRTN
ncbi:hypothetical protein EYF80_053152 [Liparis tanakae]|uniref:Uncharacterized protein n=1 Tax=Liparis tanakae TaxID=230148 RepID=A0A4Z2F786_9TELE|nr:hypothetical protein EYF80_053152 [Liparis tanakae]